MNPLELEREITKVTMAIMTRNREIASDIITDLTTKMALEEVAGVLLIGLERLMWFDGELFFWAAENLLPVEIRLEIKKILSVNAYKRLIAKGLVPGKDFSIDADGQLLHNPCSSSYFKG